MSRHRSGSKKVAPEIGLHMECVEEELEAAQISYYSKAEKEYIEVQNKLDSYIKKLKAEVIEKGDNCIVLQLNTTSPSVSLGPSTPSTNVKATRQPLQVNQNFQQIVPQGIITRSTTNSAGNTYLVMDPRLGFMVGQMPSTNVSNEQPPTPLPPKSMSGGRNRQNTSSNTLMLSTRAKSNLKKQCTTSDSEVVTPPITRTRDKAKNQFQIHQQSMSQTSQDSTYSNTNTTNTSNNYKIKMNARQIPPVSKPAENNALGGLSAGSKTPWKPYGENTSNKSSADSKEVTFNKVSGKTFPSLVVVARPHLKTKFISQSNASQERTALDAKVKGVLMFTSTKFTEWLIQQGLIRSEQSCQTHVNNDLSPVKLKLGMYSDVSQFPYSGGYVWISDCCPSNFVSVFSGSIFEGAPHPPTTLLKLIYHWACQTNVQNIVQWVKVDNLYVKNFFTNMRAVCTQAVHEKYKKMGGPRKKIEVGVISLGTTSQDGNRRQVKVEVLGVMDFENKLVRLRAVEPHSEERSFKRKFVRILEPLEEWVCKDSTILTDFTVNKAALNSMGFHSVLQVTTDVKFSNQNVMEYLRRIVPRMFQNTLSLLSRQIIQQFLDELVWREVWGPTASQAFTNIIAHMAEQTKLDVSENFLARLTRVSTNPFKQWNYASWNPVTNNNSFKTQHKSITSQDDGMVLSECIVENSGKNSRTRKRLSDQSICEDISSPPKKVTKISPSKEKLKKEDKIKTFEKAFKREKDSTEKIPEEVIKFINEGRQILLENYYYGQTNSQYTPSQSKNFFNVKCCICNKSFTENIVFMKHMILHCQMELESTVDLKKVKQCENCFLGFNSESNLKMHLEEVHHLRDNKLDSMFICYICEKKLNDRIELVYHMHGTHVQLELPYECGVCRYRTSIYKGFVDHFIKTHGVEEHVFCPFCLKVVTLSHKGTPIPLNIFFYLSHLKKHQRLTLVKKCHRCRLSFIHVGILNQHLEADHDSKKDETSVQFIKEISSKILMPEPNGTIKSIGAPEFHKLSKPRNPFNFAKFKGLDMQCFQEDLTCVECEGFFSNLDHFPGTFNCANCQYTTCCESAILEHVEIFHELKLFRCILGKPTELDEEISCICGYSSRLGNSMAKHLVLCDKKVAYFSKDLSTLDLQLKPKKNQCQENVSREGQNVLNMLGLMRKSPEIVISKDEFLEKNLKCEKALNESHCKEAQEENEVKNEKCVAKEETQNVSNFSNSSNLDQVKESFRNTNNTKNESEEAKQEHDLEKNKHVENVINDDLTNKKNKTDGLEVSSEFDEKQNTDTNNDLNSLIDIINFDVEEKQRLENVNLSIEEKNFKIEQGSTEILTDLTKNEKICENVKVKETKILVNENLEEANDENIECQDRFNTQSSVKIDKDPKLGSYESVSILQENIKDKSVNNQEEAQIEKKISDLEVTTEK